MRNYDWENKNVFYSYPDSPRFINKLVALMIICQGIDNMKDGEGKP